MRGITLLSLLLLVLSTSQNHPQAGKREDNMALHAVQSINRDGRPLHALKKLEEIETTIGESARWAFHKQRGDSYLLLNRLKDAAADFSRSLELRHTNGAQLRLATTLHRLGRWQDASEALASFKGNLLEREQNERAVLQAICDGPFRSQWPHAYRMLEARSPQGRYSVLSNLAVSTDDMEEHEATLRESEDDQLADVTPLDAVSNLATLLESTAQSMLESVGLNMDMLPGDAVFRVVTIRDQQDFEAYAKKVADITSLDNSDNQTVGFYSTSHKVLVVHALEGDTIGETGLTTATLRTLLHEMWHQLFDALTFNPPRWLDEGLAEYFAYSSFADDKIHFGQLIREHQPNESGMQEVSRFETLTGALEEDSHESLTSFLEKRTSLDGWRDADADLVYAQAWSLAYYALESKDNQFRKRYLNYIKALTKTDSDIQAFLYLPTETSEIASLEAEWSTFWLAQAHE